MRTGRWAYIGGLTLVLLGQTSVLHAQATPLGAAEASAFLDAGETSYAQGRFGDALDNFEASYRSRHEPQTLRRIGDAADKLGSHARAIEALKSYLVQVPDARDRAFVESRIQANQAALDDAWQQTLVAAKASGESFDGDSSTPRSPAPAAALSPTRSDRPGNPAGPFWIWAAGGAVVVAGIVVAALVIGSGSPSGVEPVRGNVGSAVQTLNLR